MCFFFTFFYFYLIFFFFLRGLDLISGDLIQTPQADFKQYITAISHLLLAAISLQQTTKTVINFCMKGWAEL